MIKLSRRLATIAGDIRKGEAVADIGTDHGLLPIFLWENEISPKVVLVDINQGPLDKARENMEKYLPNQAMDLRLGSGIEPLQMGEVDTIVIAGMGGLLMVDILEQNLKKTMSFANYIFQPRNGSEKLRKWLYLKGFTFRNETLVAEGRFLCEVFTVQAPTLPEIRNADGVGGFARNDARALLDVEDRRETEQMMGWFSAPSQKKVMEIQKKEESLDLEISPLLFEKRDPLLMAFVENKIRIEMKIVADILNADHGAKTESRMERLSLAKTRLALLEEKRRRIE